MTPLYIFPLLEKKNTTYFSTNIPATAHGELLLRGQVFIGGVWAGHEEGSPIPGDENSPGLPNSGMCGGLWPGHSPNGKTPVSHKVMGVPHKPGCRPRNHTEARSRPPAHSLLNYTG